MNWMKNYQLYLFDFDGLLVNTEEIHFLAYKRMLASRGYHLKWSFDRYCQAAHYDAEAVKHQLYEEFPTLAAHEPDWKVLYGEKREAVISLINEGAVHLMPGVSEFLHLLEDMKIKRCVVTHSPDELINAVRKQQPILNKIPFWITREDYSHPKPHPECYLKAVEKYGGVNEKVIGFEDTPRGIRALLGTSIKPVLICQIRYPEIPEFEKRGVSHFTSLEKLLQLEKF